MINVNMTDKAGVTLATAGKYCADNVKVTPSAEILRKDEQAKTATPTTSAQDITPDAGKALSKVTVNPITAAIVGNLDASSFAASIVAAVEGKGVTVPSGTLLDGMASLIESIETGGSLFGYKNVFDGSFSVSEDASSVTIESPIQIVSYSNVPAGAIIQATSDVGVGISQSKRYAVLHCTFKHPEQFRQSSPDYSFGFSMCTLTNSTGKALSTSYYFNLKELESNSSSYTLNIGYSSSSSTITLSPRSSNAGTAYFKPGVIYKYVIFFGGEVL